MNKEILCRPFAPEQIKQREGKGGKTISYVEAHSVIARLNEGCDQWAFEITEHQVLEEEVVVVAKLTADGIVKMAFGGSSITRDRTGRAVSVADDLKAAGTDCLKKAASLLGVALDVYGRQGGAKPSSRDERTEERVTARQLDALHSAARRKRIGRGQFTALLSERFKKTEVRHLSRREAPSLLVELTEASGTQP